MESVVSLLDLVEELATLLISSLGTHSSISFVPLFFFFLSTKTNHCFVSITTISANNSKDICTNK